MSDTNTNLYVTLMGRYGGGLVTPKLRTDLNSLSNAFSKMEGDTLRSSQKVFTENQRVTLQQMRQSRQYADEMVRLEGVKKRAAISANDAVLASRRQMDRLMLQMAQNRERFERSSSARVARNWQMAIDRTQLQIDQTEARIIRSKGLARTARSEGRAASVAAGQALGAIGTGPLTNRMLAQSSSAAMIPSQDLRAVSNLYTPGTAFTSLGGAGVAAGGAGLAGLLYGGLKLANYYGGFQSITQQTAANTNLSASGLARLRNMEIASRLQTRGTQTGVNDAYFRALNLGYRTPGGGVSPGASGFVNTVMQSALPSGASSDMVANMLGKTINSFKGNRGVPVGMSPDWYMNVIHAAGAAGNLNVQQMAQFYGPVASLAAFSGSKNSFRQSAAMVGALTAMGFTPQKGATDTASIYQHMEQPHPNAQKILADIYYATGGKTNLWGDFTQQGMAQKGAFGIMDDLKRALKSGVLTKQQLLTIVPGTRGGTGLVSLLSDAGQAQLHRAYNLTSDSQAQGQIQKQYQGWLGTRAGQLATSRANLGSLGLTLGKPLNDDLTSGIKGFNQFTGAIAGFSVKNASAVQGVEQFIIKMTTLQGAFKMIEWPIQAAGNLFSHGFVGSMKMAWETVSGFGGKVGNALTNGIPLIKGPLDAIATLFKDTFDKIGGWASDLGANIDKLMPSDHPDSVRAPKGPGHKNQHWVPPHRIPAKKGSLASHSYITVPGHWAPGALLGPPIPGPVKSTAPSGWSPSPSMFGKGFANPTHGPLNMAWDYGSPATQHDDYGAGNGGSFAVYLPPNTQWTLIEQDYASDSRGMYQVWQAPNGGLMTFMHLHDFANTKRNGSWVNGGKTVAHSGWTGLSMIYHSLAKAQAQAHLHVSLDALAVNYIYASMAKAAAGGLSSGTSGGNNKLPTPGPQNIKGAYGLLLKKHGDQFNYAALSSGVPVGILQSVAIVESGVGQTSQYYLGYMDPSTKGSWPSQIQDAASTISGYYNTPGTAAYHNWTVALEMYNAGPYATKAQLAAAKGYATSVGQAYAGLGHSSLANWNGPKGKTKSNTPYGGAIYTERHELGALNRMWHGVRASTLPATGNNGLNQQAFLQFEYKQNLLLWQIASNTDKQYALAHHMSGPWLKQMLRQEKEAYNRANQNARFRNSSTGGEANFVRMPELVGRCRAEAEANVLRRRRIKQGDKAQHDNATKIALLRKIANATHAVGNVYMHKNPGAVVGTAGHAIGNDLRLNGWHGDAFPGN